MLRMNLQIPVVVGAVAVVATCLLSCGSGSESPVAPIDPPTPEPSLFPISFGSQFDADRQVTSRASVPASSFFDNMTVYGFKTFDDGSPSQLVFTGYRLTYDATKVGTDQTNSSGWDYLGRSGSTTLGSTTWTWEQTIHYWDFAAYDYRFVAWAQPERDGQGHAIDWTGIAKPEVTVYPAVTIGEQSPYQITNNFAVFSKDVSNLLSVTVAADVADTLHAPMVSKMEVVKPSSLRTSTGMGSVVLHFSRPFCRVRFLLEDQDGRYSEMGEALPDASSLRSVTRTHFAPKSGDAALSVKGDVVVANFPVLTTATTSGVLYVKDDASRQSPSDPMTTPYEHPAKGSKGWFTKGANEEKWYTFLPTTWQEPFVMSITYGGVERTATVPTEFLNWQPGYAYTYVFKVSAHAVTFEQTLYSYSHYQSGYSETVSW